MGVSYHAFRRVAAGLLCLLLQQCTQDLPRPAPAPSRPAATAHRFADAIAWGEVVMKLEKIPRAAKAPASPQTGATAQKLLQAPCYDYYQVYYDNLGNVVGRDFLYSDCEDGGGPTGDDTGGGPNDNGGSGSTGGSSGPGGADNDEPNTLTDTMILVEGPDVPVTDIRQYLRCFDVNQPATLTVYARQPVPGTNDTYAFHGVNKPDVGHTFISISQNGITRVVGFYPISPISIFVTEPGIFGDNSQTPYTVSASKQINGGNLYSLLHYIYSADGKKYDLQKYNCTDFAIQAAHAAGIDLPDTWGRWGGIGGGSNPGSLGNDLNNNSLPAGMQKGGTSNSPSNKGTC